MGFQIFNQEKKKSENESMGYDDVGILGNSVFWSEPLICTVFYLWTVGWECFTLDKMDGWDLVMSIDGAVKSLWFIFWCLCCVRIKSEGF